MTLSAAPTAIKAAAQAYIDLVVKESDNNIKVHSFFLLVTRFENALSADCTRPTGGNVRHKRWRACAPGDGHGYSARTGSARH